VSVRSKGGKMNYLNGNPVEIIRIENWSGYTINADSPDTGFETTENIRLGTLSRNSGDISVQGLFFQLDDDIKAAGRDRYFYFIPFSGNIRIGLKVLEEK
jgi:hypothetical protein